MINLKKFYFNDIRVCCVILWDETKECVIVDPGCTSAREKSRLETFIEDNELKPVKIVLTHAHFDHILGIDFVADRWGLETYMNLQDEYLFDFAAPACESMGLQCPKLPVRTIGIKEGDKISFGKSFLEVIETPGHTPGSICLLSRDSNFILTGDTLFAGSIGRTDLPRGDYDMLMKSIMGKIISLGDEIEAIPGHGPVTTLGDERLKNPFLQPF